MRSFPIEYYVLPNVSVDGPVLGYLADCPIRDRVRDQWGKRYRYVGLVPCFADGTFNIGLLRPGEWIVEPGLVYSLDEFVTHKQRR